MDDAIELYRLIRKFIKAAGMTNKEFAERLKMNSSTFQTKMNRKAPMKMDFYQQISDEMWKIISEFDESPNAVEKAQELSGIVMEMGKYFYGKPNLFTTLNNMRNQPSPFDIFKGKSKQEKLLQEFNELNTQGQDEAIKRVQELTYIPKYRKDKED